MNLLGPAEFLAFAELDRIVLKDKKSKRSFVNFSQCRKTAIMTRVLSLIYEVLKKRIHITKRDLFYTDVKVRPASSFRAMHASSLIAVLTKYAFGSSSRTRTNPTACLMTWPAWWAAHAAA